MLNGPAPLALFVVFVSMISAAAGDVRDGKLPRDGFDLHYDTYGSGAPVLVLSGGPGFDCDYMEPVAQGTVCFPVGYSGRTARRETVNLKLYLADLEALRDSLHIDKWVVLGHSAGAILAMNYPVDFPRWVSALVLVDSGPVRQALVGAMGDNLSLRLPLEGSTKAGQPSFQTVLPGYFYDRDKAKDMITNFRSETYHGDVGQLLAASERAPGMDLRPALERLRIPALVVAGRQDPMDPGMQYELHLALKQSKLVLLDRCGHFAWLEQPEALFDAIRGFLAEHH